MKHLLTAIACCLAVAGIAQFPYNPDSDGDHLMGTEDLLSLLLLYGDEFYPEIEPVVQSMNDLSIYDIDTSFVYGGIQLIANFNVNTEFDIYVLDTDSLQATLESTYDYGWVNFIIVAILPTPAGYEKVSFAFDRDSNEYSSSDITIKVRQVGEPSDRQIALYGATSGQLFRPLIQPFIAIDGQWYGTNY